MRKDKNKENEHNQKVDRLIGRIVVILLVIPIIVAIGVVLWGYYVGYPEYVGKYSNPLPFFGYIKDEIEDKVGGVLMFYITVLLSAFAIFCLIVDGKGILGTWLMIGAGYVGYRVAKKALKTASEVTISPETKKALVTGVAKGVTTGAVAGLVINALKKKKKDS